MPLENQVSSHWNQTRQGTEDFRLGDKSKSSYSRSGGVTFAIQES